MDYEAIKRIAKETGRHIADLLALAPANDPFYITPGQRENANWFAARWQELGFSSGVHNRRIHYALVVQSPPVKRADGSDYENTEKCWNWLVNASRDARYMGPVSSDDFVDRRNPDPEINEESCDDPEPEVKIASCADLDSYSLPSVPELPDLPWALPDLPSYEPTEFSGEIEQPVMVEIWCEKTTQNDLLLPICRKYGVNLVTGAGELSETACYRFLQRVLDAGKSARILYVSDFDPAGADMPVSVARKVEFHRRMNSDFDGLSVRLNPIILTADQVAQWDLPRIPVKDSDMRKKRFEDVNGEGQVELDALEAIRPGEFSRIVTSAILRYRDLTLPRRAAQAYRDYCDYLRGVSTRIVNARYANHHEALSKEYAALRKEWATVRQEFADLTAPFSRRIEDLAGRMEELRQHAESLQDEALKDFQFHAEHLETWDAPEPNLPPEPDGQLYESRRDYLDQMAVYKRHKNGRAESASN